MGNAKIPGWILILLFGLGTPVSARYATVLPDSNTAPNYRALHGIFAVQSVVYAGALYGLSSSWYKDPLTNFHVQNDAGAWLQADKFGHVYTAYQISRYSAAIYRQTHISKKQAILYGALSGFIFQTPIELLDGFSKDYGFSPSDMLANLAGSALYAGQLLLWDDLRIHPKFSTRSTPYAALRPELLGRNRMERLLKDYNGQTYWFSVSPKSFFPHSGWPQWLCISVGYGIENMVAGEPSQSVQRGFVPYRQYYLSLDVDLTRISTRNKFVRTLLLLGNAVKIPAPALEFSRKKVKLHPLYF